MLFAFYTNKKTQPVFSQQAAFIAESLFLQQITANLPGLTRRPPPAKANGIYAVNLPHICLLDHIFVILSIRDQKKFWCFFKPYP